MNRRASLTGISTDAPGGGAKKQYNHRTEIVRMPSGSIAQIPALEPLNLSQARLNKAVVFALLVNFIAWGLILIACRWLLSVLF
ncbi:hypothetical protein [Bradyrhizobium japonicum]|uniref:hypothetical protein n=1 Tax=Bradyrhizobium japonicum TaxID=375 RepID=UPI001AEC0C7E|nr:hypothetical protein [Bradyrhizobium japonicum]